MTPEGKVKRDIEKWLAARGFWKAGRARPEGPVHGWYYMPVSNGLGVHGIPDFVCCWLGKFMVIEAKAPGGKPTENQKQRMFEIEEADGITIVCDDVRQLDSLLWP